MCEGSSISWPPTRQLFQGGSQIILKGLFSSIGHTVSDKTWGLLSMFMSEAHEFCPLKSCCPKMESLTFLFQLNPHIIYMYICIYIYLQFSEIFSYLYCLEFQRVSSPFMNFKALVWLPPIYYGIQRLGAWGTSIKSCFLMGFLASWLSSSFFDLGNITHFVVLRKNQPGYFWKKRWTKTSHFWSFLFLMRMVYPITLFRRIGFCWGLGGYLSSFKLQMRLVSRLMRFMLIQSDSGKIYDWVGTRRLLVPRVAREKKTPSLWTRGPGGWQKGDSCMARWMEPSLIWLRTLSLWLTYPKPNFLAFGEYLKWFPKKV